MNKSCWLVPLLCDLFQSIDWKIFYFFDGLVRTFWILVVQNEILLLVSEPNFNRAQTFNFKFLLSLN